MERFTPIPASITRPTLATRTETGSPMTSIPTRRTRRITTNCGPAGTSSSMALLSSMPASGSAPRRATATATLSPIPSIRIRRMRPITASSGRAAPSPSITPPSPSRTAGIRAPTAKGPQSTATAVQPRQTPFQSPLKPATPPPGVRFPPAPQNRFPATRPPAVAPIQGADSPGTAIPAPNPAPATAPR